jgi:hypothetical protein
MISGRFAPAVCLLAALALVPVILHGYVGAVAVDELRIESIPTTLAGYASRSHGRDPSWGRTNFATDDWFRRAYAIGRQDVILTVARSYDAKRLYHHPELAAAYGALFDGGETVRLPGEERVPLHVLRPAEGGRAFAVYALHYDGRFIADPIMFQLRTAGELLFSRRKAMTLLFAHQAEADRSAAPSEQPATRVLLEAIRHFDRPDTDPIG